MAMRGTKCNYTYVPTSEEYMEALGAYGSSVLIIGGLITVGLYILFFEQVLFTHVNAHRVFRRHIFWIASVYPLMSLMSVIALIVPRANNICTAVKVTYMSIGISHFTDLTQLMFGSEEVMLDRTKGERVNLQVGPLCCCCVCLPSPIVSKFSLRLVILLSDQLPFTQALYYFLVLILLSANNITLGSIEPTDASFYLSLFNIASFLSGVYALNILSYFSGGHLEHYSYRAKSFSMKTLVLITNMQGLAFDIMGNYNVFPCIPPYVPPQVYKQTAENSLYLLEMMVLGSYTFWHYHNQQFLIRPSRRVAGSSSISDARRRESVGGSRSSTSTQSTRVCSVVDEEEGLPDDLGSSSGGTGGRDGRNRDGSGCGDEDDCGRGGDRSGSGGSSGSSGGGNRGDCGRRSDSSGGSNGSRGSSRGGRGSRCSDSSSGGSSSGDSRRGSGSGRGRRKGNSSQESIEIRTITNSRGNESRTDTHRNYSNISTSVGKNSTDSGVVMGSLESSSSSRQLCTTENTRTIQSSGNFRSKRVGYDKDRPADDDARSGWMDGRDREMTKAGMEDRMNSTTTTTLISSTAIPSPRNSVKEEVDGTRDRIQGRLQRQVDQIAGSYRPQVDQISGFNRPQADQISGSYRPQADQIPGSDRPQVDQIEGFYRPQVKGFADLLEAGEMPSFVVTSGEGRGKFGRASHEEVPSIKTHQDKFRRVPQQNTHPFPLTDQLTDNFNTRESIDAFASYC